MRAFESRADHSTILNIIKVNMFGQIIGNKMS